MEAALAALAALVVDVALVTGGGVTLATPVLSGKFQRWGIKN